ncbi:uncharacterized protein EDB93DRAFT_1119664 [Suillus bovinus]|uniref:uncharacterized protein n=1 Tax=Suillus bovinus TaxID=48563 RepID=UPI001B8848CC|nr:uncharacterized protein EDB93DRAFT_1119664 [Suillus bovinus]KAG2158674.1 hypothetical protein EDB93DRAFT_1119664 [Suillus bovinus]
MSSDTEQRNCKGANAGRTPTPPTVDDMPLAAFFAQFASFSFSFNANQSSSKNFNRLIKVLKCDLKTPQGRLIQDGFRDALVQEFNARFGSDRNDLSNWQNLCRALKIDPVPGSIKACRQCVWNTNVNAVDLVDSARTGKPVKLFASLKELTAYTLQNPNLLLPKESAYQGGLLKDLLREIRNPYLGNSRNGSAKRKERKKQQKAKKTAA